MEPVHVLGGGLAGCEAAHQLARLGVPVRLWEMRPERATGAHETPHLSEMVCSNSLGSDVPTTAAGVLKAELRLLSCQLLDVAEGCRVPAGGALAVDRRRLASEVEGHLAARPEVQVVRAEACSLRPEDAARVIVASGPLTSSPLAEALAAASGAEHLFFYDAIAPIVDDASLDRGALFRASRREPDAPGDYLNVPLDRAGYDAFVDGLLAADGVTPHPFEEERLFEGCQPIEAIAARGRESLRFGPMRPVGLVDPRTGHRPWAVVQLRMENAAGSAWGLVGFQTRLRHGEQRRLLRTLPGLGAAEFLRLGSVHRNTYLDAPACLDGELRLRGEPAVRVAGQLAGCEGYVESTALGLMAALWTAAELRGAGTLPAPPRDTMLGALLAYLREGGPGGFAPVNANFGLLPPLAAGDGPRGRRGRRARRAAMAERARSTMAIYAKDVRELFAAA